MLIGLDFDNTIVCYDSAIAVLADELLDLPAHIPRKRFEIRNFLRNKGREDEWTSFQGEIYGPGMKYAAVFEHAIPSMLQLASNGHEFVILSHRSVRPFIGPPYDLHAFAKNWITRNLSNLGIFNSNSVHFFPDKVCKIDAIGSFGVKVFLDDLPEIILDHKFPKSSTGVLFDPEKKINNDLIGHKISSWRELPTKIRSIS